MIYVLGLGLLAAFGWLLWQNRTAMAARRAARAGYFAEVLPLLGGLHARVEASGFQRVAGDWGGRRFDLQAVPDTLSYRKLPVLWVMVTLTEAVPVTGAAHIMMRPSAGEVFSHYGLMPQGVALPAGFPDGCALRCEDAAGLPLEVIAAQAGLFADRAMKELVIAPNGLRIVFVGEEAERVKYLLYRDAELGMQPLPVARLVPYLQALIALQARLREVPNG